MNETAPPFLSVIMPVFNREHLVKRALASVLGDDARDIEVIVVDDGSTDGTVRSVQSFRDARVQMVQLQVNGGQCPARNRGAEAARGEWLLFLDSDDELVPGSLDVIRRAAQGAAQDVGKLLFSCRDDNGAVSPSPALDGRVVDYVGYLRWQEETSQGASEALPVTRRGAFLSCPYPEERSASEGIHELDFAKRWKLLLRPEVVRLFHLDADNRLTTPDSAKLIEKARGIATHAETMLLRHGEAMRVHAPSRWTMCIREAALYSFLSGNRAHGIRHSLNVLKQTPRSARTWATLAAGILGPGPLSRLWSSTRARRAAA